MARLIARAIICKKKNTLGIFRRLAPDHLCGMIVKYCIFCGNCEEACPEEAIFMSDDCEISMLDRKKMLYTKEQLLTPVADLQKRIEFTRNMYAKWNY